MSGIERARRLRRDMSPPEVVLWQHLRRRPGGFKFRRQHRAEPYTLDFYCREAALAIEVDGSPMTWETIRRVTHGAMRG